MTFSYAEMDALLYEELRLYHHPIAVTFLRTPEEVENYKKNNEFLEPVKPLTFCQWEIAARMQGKNVLGTAEKLACSSARIGFGWQEIDEQEIASHLKYCTDREQTIRFLESKPRLPMGSVLAVAVGPWARLSLSRLSCTCTATPCKPTTLPQTIWRQRTHILCRHSF